MAGGESGIDTVSEACDRRDAERGRRSLVIVSLAASGSQVAPVGGCPTLGRGRPAAGHDLTRVQVADRLLSRRHLRIVGRKGGHNVEDLGSLNGSSLTGTGWPRRRLCLMGTFSCSEAGLRPSGERSRRSPKRRQRLFGLVAALSLTLSLTLVKSRRLAVGAVEPAGFRAPTLCAWPPLDIREQFRQ